MINSDLSEIGVLQDAIDITYSPLSRLMDKLQDRPINGGSSAHKRLPQPVPNLKHATPRVRQTWLDHTIPLPLSSSPMSSPPKSSRVQREHVLDTYDGADADVILEAEPDHMDHDSDTDFEPGLQHVALDTMPALPDNHYMSGALHNEIPSIRRGTDAEVFTNKHITDHTYNNGVTNLAGLQSFEPIDYSPLSPTESELRQQNFEFHSDLPEAERMKYIGDDGLKRILKNISPKLSRKAQWYAWRKAQDMLATMNCTIYAPVYYPAQDPMSDAPPDVDWLAGVMQPTGTLVSVGKEVRHNELHSFHDNHDQTVGYVDCNNYIHTEFERAPVPNIKAAAGEVPRRHPSDGSQISIPMDISPEDQHSPTSIQSCKYQSRLTPEDDHNQTESKLQTTDVEMMYLDHSESWPVMPDAHHLQPRPDRPDERSSFAEVGFTCLAAPGIVRGQCIRQNDQKGPTWPSVQTSTPEQRYQVDHRGFQIRPVNRSRQSTTASLDSSNALHGMRYGFESGKEKFGTPPPRSYSRDRSSSPFPTPLHMTPTNHSPLRRPDTPRPSLSNITILPTIERPHSPYGHMRESTPGYEDRSPSPSPIDHTSATKADAVMHDVYSYAHPMLPPPHPARSHTSSPTISSRTHETHTPVDPFNTTVPRSLAVARVMRDSQSPCRSTPYPHAVGLEPGSTNKPFQRQPSPSRLHYDPVDTDGSLMMQDRAVEHGSPRLKLKITVHTSNTSPGTGAYMIPPPPIPKEEVKVVKRRGGRKSGVCEAVSRMGKAKGKTRSVTLSAGETGGGSGVKKERARTKGGVTQGLVHALELEGRGSETQRKEGCSADVWMADMNGTVRRSARLRVKKF